MLSKVEITIDYNGPAGQTLSFKYLKTEWWIFSKFTKLFVSFGEVTFCLFA